MQRMFRRQNLEPRYRFVDHDDVPVGSVVDIDLNGHTLRVHMNKDVPVDWSTIGTGELILGPGITPVVERVWNAEGHDPARGSGRSWHARTPWRCACST